MTTSYRESDRAALREACLRLAWYIAQYGGIPQSEFVKLFVLATMGRGEEAEQSVLQLARMLETHFIEMHSAD